MGLIEQIVWIRVESKALYLYTWYVDDKDLRPQYETVCPHRHAVSVPVPGLYWSDAASIGPVQARYWQLTACFCTV